MQQIMGLFVANYIVAKDKAILNENGTIRKY
jgi:hypothetical protein